MLTADGLDKPELVIAPELTRAIFLCFPVHFLICVRPISRPLGSHELVLEQKGSCIRKWFDTKNWLRLSCLHLMLWKLRAFDKYVVFRNCGLFRYVEHFPRLPKTNSKTVICPAKGMASCLQMSTNILSLRNVSPVVCSLVQTCKALSTTDRRRHLFARVKTCEGNLFLFETCVCRDRLW